MSNKIKITLIILVYFVVTFYIFSGDESRQNYFDKAVNRPENVSITAILSHNAPQLTSWALLSPFSIAGTILFSGCNAGAFSCFERLPIFYMVVVGLIIFYGWYFYQILKSHSGGDKRKTKTLLGVLILVWFVIVAGGVFITNHQDVQKYFWIRPELEKLQNASKASLFPPGALIGHIESDKEGIVSNTQLDFLYQNPSTKNEKYDGKIIFFNNVLDSQTIVADCQNNTYNEGVLPKLTELNNNMWKCVTSNSALEARGQDNVWYYAIIGDLQKPMFVKIMWQRNLPIEPQTPRIPTFLSYYER